MLNVATALGLIAGLFVAVLGLVEAGLRLGLRRKSEGLAAIDGAVFGLMGLLLAFTFGSAAVRFDIRRNLIVEEANDISTAYLRLDLLPALNAIFDITTTRTVALQTHQPAIIFVMLAVVMLACSLLAGFSMGVGTGRSWLHVACFAAVLTIPFYVILDLEYPRIGLINVDWMDRILMDVRSSMG